MHTACIRIGPNGIACVAQGEGEKSNADLDRKLSRATLGHRSKRVTHIRGDTSDDNLIATRRLHSLTELCVVPCIHLTMALHKGRLRVHGKDFSGDATVGTLA